MSSSPRSLSAFSFSSSLLLSMPEEDVPPGAVSKYLHVKRGREEGEREGGGRGEREGRGGGSRGREGDCVTECLNSASRPVSH